MTIVPENTSPTPTAPASTPATPETPTVEQTNGQADAGKPKFNANAPRRHRVTGATLALYTAEHAEDVAGGNKWVTECQTHGAHTFSRTRNWAEEKRVKPEFCPECSKLLTATSTSTEPQSQPEEAMPPVEAVEAVQPAAKVKRPRTKASK
jgi:hypothetical protein